VANLFPHSPAKAGPLREEPNWSNFLLGGLLPVASEVGAVLGGALNAPVGGAFGAPGRPATAPAAVSGGGPTIINFTYAPAVSLADEREAQERIAPVIRRVVDREKRRW
jgi:hypothetical protein